MAIPGPLHTCAVLIFTIGCSPKAGDTASDAVDEPRAESDTPQAVFTITDLNDATGLLQETWVSDSPRWMWADGDAALLKTWSIDPETNEIRGGGSPSANFLPLFADTVAGSATCAQWTDLLLLGQSLFQDFTSGDPVSMHCDAITEWFAAKDAMNPLHDVETLFGAQAGTFGIARRPPVGDVHIDEMAGEKIVQLRVSNATQRPSAAWNPETCQYTQISHATVNERWSGDFLSLRIDAADDLISGQLTVELDDDAGRLEVDFQAESCEHSTEPGALLMSSSYW
jgi:hypothetical protein